MRVGIATFTKLKKGRAKVNILASIDKKSSVALLASLTRSAKDQGVRTLFGSIVSNKSASLIKAKKGKLLSLSKSGGKRLVGLIAAKGEITRFKKGNVRALITGIMRLK